MAVTIGLLLVASVFPVVAQPLFIVTLAALLVASVIAALVTKNTAKAQSLVATLIWCLVLFEFWR